MNLKHQIYIRNQLVVRVEGKISYSRLYNNFLRPTSTIDHTSGYLRKRDRVRLTRSVLIV